MTLVSIVVPAFNVEACLDECLISLAIQSYAEIEVILVDDGSTDATPEVCDAWAVRDERICVLHQSNNGLSSARNAGIECASGDYLAFVDGDDLVAPQFIAELLRHAVGNDADIVVSRLEPFEDQQAPTYSPGTALPRVMDAEEGALEILTRRANWSPCAKLYRRELFENELRFRPGILFEDLEFAPRVFAEAETVVLLDSVTYAYRQRVGSIMQRARRAMSQDLITVLDLNIAHARSHYGPNSSTARTLVTAYVLHAAKTVELMTERSTRLASGEFLWSYRRFISRHLREVRQAHTVGRMYLALLQVSRFSPSAFILLFQGATWLKRRGLSSLRRSSG